MEAALFSDHYTTLGVRRTASNAEIRRAYRRLVLRYHPDRQPAEADAAKTFQKITDAYKALSDPERRQAYDDVLKAYRDFAPPAQVPQTALKDPPISKVRLKLSYLNVQNPLRVIDACRGATLAAAIFPFLVSRTAFVPESLQTWELPLVSFLFGATALMGWALGSALRSWVQGVAEFIFRLPEIGEAAREFAPFILSALLSWAAGKLLQPSLAGFPLTGLFPAILGGAVGAWVGAAVGRAFSFAEEIPHRVQGALTSAISGGLVGALIGFILTASTSDVLAGARFFSLWACSGGAALAGASLAAVYGAIREPDPFAQDP